jgi:hypothetical protein
MKLKTLVIGKSIRRVTLTGTFRVTLYNAKDYYHQSIVTRKHQLRPAGGRTLGG